MGTGWSRGPGGHGTRKHRVAGGPHLEGAARHPWAARSHPRPRDQRRWPEAGGRCHGWQPACLGPPGGRGGPRPCHRVRTCRPPVVLVGWDEARCGLARRRGRARLRHGSWDARGIHRRDGDRHHRNQPGRLAPHRADARRWRPGGRRPRRRDQRASLGVPGDRRGSPCGCLAPGWRSAGHERVGGDRPLGRSIPRPHGSHRRVDRRGSLGVEPDGRSPCHRGQRDRGDTGLEHPGQRRR